MNDENKECRFCSSINCKNYNGYILCDKCREFMELSASNRCKNCPQADSCRNGCYEHYMAVGFLGIGKYNYKWME